MRPDNAQELHSNPAEFMKIQVPMIERQQFPDDFVWGVATSAFQIEGAAAEDGKGQSIWDIFCRNAGAIADASNGDIACDHYARWESDLDIVSDLGVNAYRFSISWPRVRPTGSGDWNALGLDFYERMVDRLLQSNIKPFVTLNHWDLPQALQTQGGWVNRDTVHRFVEYAEGIHRRMGDRIASIASHNEPWVIAVLGHEKGVFAPGIASRSAAAQVSHHLLLSHGLAVQALRAQNAQTSLGIVLNLSPMHPATNSVADRMKALLEDGRLVRWYMDPLFKGSYPQDVLDDLGADMPVVHSQDMKNIATPLDFLGVNYYTRSVASADGSWKAGSTGLPVTEMGWEIYPQGLTELLLRLHHDYALPPVLITESGGAFKDVLEAGCVHDFERTQYVQQHIAALADAMRQGVDVRGYMVWSLMDNFEWASGYEKRFGIVHVDYATQVRTLKDSAHWYRDFLRQDNTQRAAAR
jgi:beta-glucosidase